ncbi:MAG: hypothetical protein WD534_06295 [Phycisphaeraceae bacterium]
MLVHSSTYVRSIVCLLMLALPAAAHALERGLGTITFVDGEQTEAEVLFEHPEVDRLILRSPQQSTVQSLDLALVHAVTVDGETTRYHEPRELSDAEAEQLRRNGLWGDAVGEGQLGRYADESWQRKPLIVWRYPGQDGNAMQASNWLNERGEPLGESPWREPAGRGRNPEGAFDGDILLPAAGKPYGAIQPGHRDHLSAFAVRHITVEKNASYNIRYTIKGNLWIKHLGHIGDGTQTGGLGSRETNKHTFARFSGDRPGHGRAGAAGYGLHTSPDRGHISHWVRIDTGETGSLEIIGDCGGASDRTSLQQGTLIVSTDSHLGNGPRASFYTEPDTTLVLLDGASIGCPDRVLRSHRSTAGIAGTLMFGHPDKPLTRDLRFALTLYNRDQIDSTVSPSQRTTGASIVLGESGSMVIHSTDPTQARVIFCPPPEDAPYSNYAVGERANGRPMPTGIAAVFRGQTDFNGVVFEGFHEGGIVVHSDARQRWQNVSFEDNLAEPEQLFRW